MKYALKEANLGALVAAGLEGVDLDVLEITQADLLEHRLGVGVDGDVGDINLRPEIIKKRQFRGYLVGI